MQKSAVVLLSAVLIVTLVSGNNVVPHSKYLLVKIQKDILKAETTTMSSQAASSNYYIVKCV